MDEVNPLWIIAAIAVIGVVYGIGEWTGNVNSDRKSFKTFMKDIRKKIDEILERLPPRTETAASPIRLTDFGLRISEQVRATELARELAHRLRARVEGLEDYDIQETCLTFVENEYEPIPEVDARIKKVAFDNGLERRQVLRVIGLELRDILSGLKE